MAETAGSRCEGTLRQATDRAGAGEAAGTPIKKPAEAGFLMGVPRGYSGPGSAPINRAD